MSEYSYAPRRHREPEYVTETTKTIFRAMTLVPLALFSCSSEMVVFPPPSVLATPISEAHSYFT